MDRRRAVSHGLVLGSIVGTELDCKRFLAGTHRVMAPEATLSRISRHFSSFGITRFGNVTGLDCIGIPVYQCIRPTIDIESISHLVRPDFSDDSKIQWIQGVNVVDGEKLWLPRDVVSLDRV